MLSPTDLQVKKALLKHQSCFEQLTDEEMEILASLLFEKHVKAFDTIVSEGDYVDSVYFIVSGTADVRRMMISENKLIEDKIEDIQTSFTSIANLVPGDAIGLNETGFYALSGVRTATVVALTDMILLSLSVATFHGFALAHHHVNQVMREQAEMILNRKT